MSFLSNTLVEDQEVILHHLLRQSTLHPQWPYRTIIEISQWARIQLWTARTDLGEVQSSSEVDSVPLQVQIHSRTRPVPVLVQAQAQASAALQVISRHGRVLSQLRALVHDQAQAQVQVQAQSLELEPVVAQDRHQE